MYSKKITSLSESMTIAITTLAKRLKQEGKDVISFSAGEPDFDTPQAIKDEAKRAIDEGFTKYTPVSGIAPLLKAIKEKLKRENDLEYDLDEIVVSNGAKHSLFNTIQALVDDGDEVIIPAPYWVTYPELVTYSGGKSVIVECDESSGFKLTPKALKDAITTKTKMLILTTPSNPTGAIYTKDELISLAKVLEGTSIMVISDEMYEKLIYDNKSFHSCACVSADMLNRTITINGLSKSVSMTGWRVGYLATKDKKLVKLIDSLQSQCTSNINSITQIASIAGLDGRANSDVEMMRVEFEKRRDIACDMFNKIDKISVLKPDGAFYLFVNIRDVGMPSLEFCKLLLEKEGVAVVPGVGFGMEGYFRFSFATDLESIKDGISRIESFVKSL